MCKVFIDFVVRTNADVERNGIVLYVINLGHQQVIRGKIKSVNLGGVLFNKILHIYKTIIFNE